jgi:hypothetical protein
MTDDPRVTCLVTMLRWAGNGEHTPEDYDEAERLVLSLAADAARAQNAEQRAKNWEASKNAWQNTASTYEKLLALEVRKTAAAVTRAEQAEQNTSEVTRDHEHTAERLRIARAGEVAAVARAEQAERALADLLSEARFFADFMWLLDPANDEMVSIRASRLYRLMQAHDRAEPAARSCGGEQT